MKKILIALICLLVISRTYAQQPETKVLSVIKNGSGKGELVTANLIIDPKDVISLDVKSDSVSDAQVKYGATPGTVIIFVTPKPTVELLKAAELFGKFKIDKQHQTLKIRLDGKLLTNRDLLAQASAVKSINVNVQENVIDIISKAASTSAEKSGRANNNQVIIR